MRRSYRPLRWLLWLVLAALLLGGAFFFDAGAQAWFARHQSPGMHDFMDKVSRWGDWPTLVVLGLLGALLAYALGNRRWIMVCIAMIIACSLAGSINRVIKIGTGRARPAVKVDAGWNGPRLSSKYHAFPSGHTASSVGFFVTLLLARRRIGLALLPFPLLIAFSRLYLNAHHFSDVVGGAIVGVLCAVGTWSVISANMLDTRSKPRSLLV